MVLFSDARFGVAATALFCIALSTWVWMLHAWTTPAEHRRTGGNRAWEPHEPCFTFSLLVPARHESAVLGPTLERLAGLDHPWFEVIAIVGDDDPATREVAEEVAARWPGIVRVVVDDSVPKSKPRALNTGLAASQGEIVGVFDAEDEVSLDLLRQADAVLEQTGAQVVQGGVQLVTLRSSWFAVRNCLEYMFWFRSRLHAHARQGFAPLGGNTVFFRRDSLLESGGWDGACLAEDCEIGIRLSATGAKVAVWFDPQTCTREETPETLRAFTRQRTRWDQGYIQVLRKRQWRSLPTRRQRLLARYVLAFPLIQASAGLLLPASIVLLAVGTMPLLLTLVAFAPVVMMCCVVVTELVGLFELSRTFHLRAGLRDYVMLALTTIPYMAVLAFAGLRAAWREFKGRGGWEKTEHSGLHREPKLSVVGES